MKDLIDKQQNLRTSYLNQSQKNTFNFHQYFHIFGKNSLFLPKRRENDEKNYLKKYNEEKRTLDFYRLFYEVLEACQFNQLFYILLIIVEQLQVQYFAWHPFLDSFLFDTEYRLQLRNIIQYFQVYFIIFDGNSFIMIILLYSLLGLLLVAVGISYFIYKEMQKTNRKLVNQSTLINWSLKLLHIYMALMITVIPMPMFNIFITFLQCNSSRYMKEFTCYQGQHLIHLPFALIGLILFIFQTIVCHIYFNDSNPNSKFPLAQPETLNLFLKLGLKFALSYYFIIDPDGNLVSLYNIFFMFFEAYILNERFMAPAMYNRIVFCVQIFVECTTLFTLCVNILVKYIDPSANNVGFFYTLIGGPLLYTFFITGYDFYTLQISKKTIEQILTDNDKQSFILQFFILIKNRHNYNKAIMLEGMCRWHQINCEVNTCYCRLLKVDEMMNRDQEYSEEEHLLIEKKWYLFLESIIQQLILKANKPFKLHLLWAYILSDKLDNHYRSLIELMNTIHSKPSFQEVYSVYRHQCIIQQNMFEEFDKKSENIKELDYDKIVIYSDKIVILQEEIDKSCVLHMNYWRELMEQSPEIQKIEQIGQRITETNFKIKQMFDDITGIYPQNIKLLTLYGNYLRLILNETEESAKYLDSVDSIKKQQANSQALLDLHKIKYGQNSKVGMILCNAKHDVVGTIHKLNKEALMITKFKKHELIDQNVSKIMPKIYQDLHDSFMVNFLVTSQPKVMETDRIVMVQNKCFQLIPCSIYLRMVSTLEEGLLIAGFINEIQYKKPYKQSQKKSTSSLNAVGLSSSDHYILYRPDNDVVEGISKSLTNKLGIPVDDIQRKMQSNSNLSMERIVPDIYDPEGVENMQNGNGQLMELDVIQILYYYMLDEEDEDAVDDSDKQESDEDGSNSSSSISSEVDSGEEGLSKITEEDKLIDPSQRSKRQSRGKSFSEKNSLKSKINKMQRLKVRVYLVQQDNFSGKKINLIKLTEEEDSEDGKSEYKRNDYKKLAKTLIGGKTLTARHNDSEKEDLQTKDSNQNEKEIEQQLGRIKSNSSNGTESLSQNYDSSQLHESVNEEQMRNLKDFKARISEKKIPQSVQIMDKVIYFLLAFVSSLLIAEFVIKYNSTNDFQKGATSITNSYNRHNQMSDINYYSRKIWAIANDYWAPPSGSTKLAFMKLNQDTLAQHVTLLQKTQFQIIKDVLEVNKITPNTYNNIYISTESMLQNGDVVENQVEFTDSIFSYTTGSSSLSNSTLENMQFPDGKVTNPLFIGSSQKYFYYNKVNGIFVQRDTSEQLADLMLNFYYDLTNYYHDKTLTIFIIALVVVFLGIIAILPFLLKVHKANNKVLSLFGLISIKEIQELVVKVENFQNLFLDSKEDERITELSKLQTQKASLQNQQTQNAQANNHVEEKEIFEIKNETESDKLNESQNAQNNFEVYNKLQDNNINNFQHEAEHEENQESTHRSQNQNNSQLIINGKDKQFNQNNMSKFAQIQPAIASDNKLSQKKENNDIEMADVSLQDAASYQKSRDAKTKNKERKGRERKLSQKIERDEKEVLLERSQKIMESTNSSSLLDIYKIIFFSLIFFSIFIVLYFTNETNLSNIRSIFSHFQLLQQRNPLIKKETTPTSKIADYINGDDFQNTDRLLLYISGPNNSLRENFQSAIQDYLDSYFSTCLGLFVSFFLLSLSILALCWIPFKNNLIKKVWRVKGMLNMIPMNILVNDQNVKEAIQNQNILKAVQ